MKIHEFLKKHRKKEHTLYYIAKRTGIAHSNITKIFAGESEPKTNNFIKIVQVLNIDNKNLTDFVNKYKS